MNPFAIISLVTFVACLLLGVFIYFRNPKVSLNRYFLLGNLVLAHRFLIEFGYNQSITRDQAMGWWQWDLLWPFATTFYLLFTLVSTERAHLAKARGYRAMLFGMPAVFIVSKLVGYPAFAPPIHHPWGFSYALPNNNVMGILAYMWTLGAACIGTLLAAHYFFTTSDHSKYRQARLMLVGLVILTVSFAAEIALDTSYMSNPPLFRPGIVIFNGLLAYGIIQHESFVLVPKTAADEIIQTMTDCLLLLDPNRTIVTANAAFKQLMGYTDDALTELSWNDLAVEDDRDSMEKMEAIFDSQDDYLELNLKKADGNPLPVSLSGSELRDDNGTLRGHVLIARNITEQIAMDKELADYRDHLEELVAKRTQQLAQSNAALLKETQNRLDAEARRREVEEQLRHTNKMEAVGRLAGGVAHDFNNLLLILRADADFLLANLPPSHPARINVKEIIDSTVRGSTITKQLLAFSRKDKADPRPLEVPALLENNHSLLRRVIGEDIELTMETEDTIPRVFMDANQLDQAIVNIVINSREAMPEGGKIHIVARNTTLVENETQNPEARPGRYVAIGIRDTGCGMDKEVAKKIFDPFFTTKDPSKAAGLGLSIVYGIVKQSGGFIEVRSKPAEGATVELYLPAVVELAPKAG